MFTDPNNSSMLVIKGTSNTIPKGDIFSWESATNLSLSL